VTLLRIKPNVGIAQQSVTTVYIVCYKGFLLKQDTLELLLRLTLTKLMVINLFCGYKFYHYKKT